MSDEKMEAMKRAWDKVIIACAEEGLNTEEKLHLLKSMEAFLSDVLQANEKQISYCLQQKCIIANGLK